MKRLRPAGFTLVEAMIAATPGTVALAGVLSAFLFLARTGFRSSGYSEMEAEIRRGLDTFARDTRNATNAHWNSAQNLTLTVSGSPVTYACDRDAASATAGSFYRLADRTRTVPIRGVNPDFAFQRCKPEQPGVSDNRAGNDSETKLLQLTLRAVRALDVTGNASIIVPDGSSLTVYIEGDCKIAGNGLGNGNRRPGTCQIWGTSTSAAGQSFQVAGNGALKAVIYAPNADVKLNGNGDIMGAVVARDVIFTGNARFHYDESLANPGDNAPFGITRWRELMTAEKRARWPGVFSDW